MAAALVTRRELSDDDLTPWLQRLDLEVAAQAAQRAWHRAWQRYRAQDQISAAHRFETTEPAAPHWPGWMALLVRIDEIEASLAKTPARTRAELRIKIAILSLDGALRPEFQDAVRADVERLLPTGAMRNSI
ncbi:hypothetical protein PLESTB_001923900 [Pleodorina starrii]|uniref:Uncharacterized protein n=1 Tax=Pleodorina starrii TaxID=330485 RepID=A0A9W6C3C0_9CHLO|nr:hypothetical protein PLESTB_001923900 [Pleodorina starrii]